MIISLSQEQCELPLEDVSNTDIYCFFEVNGQVQCPQKDWFFAIKASLRMKRNVLILEAHLRQFPKITLTARFYVAENWLWVTPRMYNLLSDAYSHKSPTYVSIKSFLTTYN